MCNPIDSKKYLQNFIFAIDSYICSISNSDWILILLKELIFARKASTHFLKFSQRIFNYTNFTRKTFYLLALFSYYIRNFMKSKNAKEQGDAPTDSHLFHIPHFYVHSTLKRSLPSTDLISFQDKFWKFQSTKPTNTKFFQFVDAHLTFKHISLGNFCSLHANYNFYLS